MRKFILFTAVAAFLMVAACGSAVAYSNAPNYLGTFSGNDNDFDAIEAQINTALGGTSYDINFYAKVDEPATSSGGLTLTYNPGNLSGTWATADPIYFYSIKAGPNYALWQVNPDFPDVAGDWTTDNLVVGRGNQPAISHMSAFTTRAVPIPAGAYLLGMGFVGLVGGRRRIQKMISANA